MRSETKEIEEAVRGVIRCWPRTELAEFAIQRRGYGNDDGGFGIVYPEDLDGADREPGQIPPGCVQVYWFWGAPEGQTWLAPEPLYLRVLAEQLQADGLEADAARVRALYVTLSR